MASNGLLGYVDALSGGSISKASICTARQHVWQYNTMEYVLHLWLCLAELNAVQAACFVA
jgi:hypothetical protein